MKFHHVLVLLFKLDINLHLIRVVLFFRPVLIIYSLDQQPQPSNTLVDAEKKPCYRNC